MWAPSASARAESKAALPFVAKPLAGLSGPLSGQVPQACSRSPGRQRQRRLERLGGTHHGHRGVGVSLRPSQAAEGPCCHGAAIRRPC